LYKLTSVTESTVVLNCTSFQLFWLGYLCFKWKWQSFYYEFIKSNFSYVNCLK